MTTGKKITSYSNIALIKYWGKSDIESNIPVNSSISITLPNLKTETSISFNSCSSAEDEFFLNGMKIKIRSRMSNLIEHFKKLVNDKRNIQVISINNFPHSCGLASSASGFSALVKALDNFYDTKLSKQELCNLSRLGSGSACRSIYDGIVVWEDTSVKKIGEWENLRIFNIVVSKDEKKIGSTEGMIRTVKTSTLLAQRLRNIDEKIKKATEYIEKKDFESLGELVMRESNEIHALCLDSFPPIIYLNDKSKEIIDDVFEKNRDSFKLFYTFDAGPNPFIFALEDNFEEIINYFERKYKYEIIICK